jgi:hypothetical protein
MFMLVVKLNDLMLWWLLCDEMWDGIEIEPNFLFVFLPQLLLEVAAEELGVGSLAHGCGYRRRQLGWFFFLENPLVPVRITNRD